MTTLNSLLKRASTLWTTAGEINPKFVKKGGWLGHNLAEGFVPPMLPVHHTVEERAGKTHRTGDRPLWEGYQSVKGYPRGGDTRKPDQVRSDALVGRFYSWLASQRREDAIVEFGTAFGVSGMYWLSGMSAGQLYTFEPNANWAASAEENLRSISYRFTLTVDTFETVGPTLLAPQSVGIAFVDAIHTSEFVFRQYDILKPLMKPGALALFDDIDFSPDMADCWRRIAADPSLAASATLTDRVGIVELPS